MTDHIVAVLLPVPSDVEIDLLVLGSFHGDVQGHAQRRRRPFCLQRLEVGRDQSVVHGRTIGGQAPTVVAHWQAVEQLAVFHAFAVEQVHRDVVAPIAGIVQLEDQRLPKRTHQPRAVVVQVHLHFFFFAAHHLHQRHGFTSVGAGLQTDLGFHARQFSGQQRGGFQAFEIDGLTHRLLPLDQTHQVVGGFQGAAGVVHHRTAKFGFGDVDPQHTRTQFLLRQISPRKDAALAVIAGHVLGDFFKLGHVGFHAQLARQGLAQFGAADGLVADKQKAHQFNAHLGLIRHTRHIGGLGCFNRFASFKWFSGFNRFDRFRWLGSFNGFGGFWWFGRFSRFRGDAVAVGLHGFGLGRGELHPVGAVIHRADRHLLISSGAWPRQQPNDQGREQAA